MSTPRQAMVISIAAAPGGGKTTLSKMVSAKLGNAPILHYDDHEALTQRGVAGLEAWIGRGARLDEIPVPGFAEALARLRTSGAPYVLVDGPLGRSHPSTARVTDFLIFIDTPLDLALARVIRDQAKRAAGSVEPEAGRNFTLWLEGYLDSYVRFTRRSYDAQRAAVMPQADLVLDGSLSVENLGELAMQAIAKRPR